MEFLDMRPMQKYASSKQCLKEADCDKFDQLHFRRYFSYASSCDEKIDASTEIEETEGYDEKYLGYYNSRPNTVGKNGCLGPESIGQSCPIDTFLGRDTYKKVVTKGQCVMTSLSYMG